MKSKLIYLPCGLAALLCAGNPCTASAQEQPGEDGAKSGSKQVLLDDDKKKVRILQQGQGGAAMESEPHSFAWALGGGGAAGEGITFLSDDPGAGSSLIVRGPEMDDAAQTRLTEDLAVMGRILQKELQKELGPEAVMGIPLIASPFSRRPNSIYLEGYGALFLLNVRFPLLPPAEPEKPEKEAETDSTWENARRELYGAPQPRAGWRVARNAIVSDVMRYDRENVESLKSELIASLKHATHIRGLKPDESVTLVVHGPPAAHGGKRSTSDERTARVYTLRNNDMAAFSLPLSGSGGTTLTLRAKKRDIDAFAKGDLDLEAFKERVTLAAY